MYTPRIIWESTVNRSPAITFSAVLLFIGGGLTLLGGLLISGIFFFGFQGYDSDLPRFFAYFIFVIFILEVCAGAWAIWTGVGLLQYRNWARISTIVFACLLLFLSLPGLLILPLIGLLPHPPSLPPPPPVVRIFQTIFYALLATLGGWWLYFFNTPRVKVLFGQRPYPIAPPITPPTPEPGELSGRAPERPISITVVAGLLLLGAVNGPMALVITSIFKLPGLFFGFFIRGWWAEAILVVYLVVHVSAGIGLIKLKMWARTLAIWYFSFAMLNGIATILRPGGIDRLEQFIIEIYTKMIPVQASNILFPPLFHQIFHAAFIVGTLIGFGACGIQLWLVVTRKEAFLAANQS